MAANGAVTPPQTLDTALPHSRTAVDHKRKRDDDELASLPTGDAAISRSTQTQRDILEVLQQHDTSPSFLDRALLKTTNEPSPKKARLSDESKDPGTISSKLSHGAYASLHDLRKDAEQVCEEIVASIRLSAKEREGEDVGKLLVDDLKQIQRVQAYARAVKNVLEQEAKYESAHAGTDTEDKTAVNGHVTTTKVAAPVSAKNGTVLTLFGNAPTPKQLFSSMQNPVSVEQPGTKTELPIDEMRLPNGLTATKIVPVPGNEDQKGPTFEDAFPAPHNLHSLHPPKSQNKRSTTRDTTLTWEFKDEFPKSNKKGGYTVQGLTVADWLSYGGGDPSMDPASPREKRKQRDRALSGDESSQPALSKESLHEALAREEEALFRRAYSSFAPSCDNTKALIPEQSKNMVWWQKVGYKKYEETFAIDPALLDEQPGPQVLDGLPPVIVEGDDDFSMVVEELDDFDDTPELETVKDKTDAEQVLRGISDLLETLASHQRIRNTTLGSSTSASRTPISPAPTLSSRIGKPNSPADDEITTYHSLRRELAYLILKLPPYAVAKLKSDQLSELGISRLITFQSKDVKGTMEEDQVSKINRYSAMASAAGLATLQRSSSGNAQHYSSTNQRTPAIGQAANTRYGQSSQYGATRTPATQPQPNRNLSYGTPSATNSRAYVQPNQYSRPVAQQHAYGQTNGPQLFQRPAQQMQGGFGGYGQHYGTGSIQQRSSFSSSGNPLAQYQQRLQSQAAAQSAAGNQTNSPNQTQTPFNRTASPIKPVQPAPMSRPLQQFQNSQPGQQHFSQSQSQQPGSGRATPVSYPSQPQTPVNGYARAPPPLQPGPPRAASGTPQPIQPAPPPSQGRSQVD